MAITAKTVHVTLTRGAESMETSVPVSGIDAGSQLDTFILLWQRRGYAVEITGETATQAVTTRKEAIHDAEIRPLMEQISAICRREDIPCVASFQLDDVRAPGTGFLCSTRVCPVDTHPTLLRMALALSEH